MFRFVPVFLLVVFQVEAFINVDVKKWETCLEYKKQIIKHWATFEKINDTAIMLTGELSSPIELGVDVTFKIFIECLMDGVWKEYHTLIQKNPCSVFNAYLGDMWYDLQENAGMTPGVCPLPKGDFKVKNHILDLTRLPSKSGFRVPLRATAILRNDQEVLLCVNVEMNSY